MTGILTGDIIIIDLIMKYTTVSIPQPLDDKVRKLIKKTGFASTSAFVIFLLRELLIEQDGKLVIAGRDAIKKRLRALGYL